MIDQRLASVSRNLRAEGHVDNDPDATLAAIRLIALADALEAQQPNVPVQPRAEKIQAPPTGAAPQAATEEAQPRSVASGGEDELTGDRAGR